MLLRNLWPRLSSAFGVGIIVVSAICASLTMASAEDFITIQSTTSTRDSGLYDFILPVFQKSSGIEVRVVSVGTGQAIKNAADCNGDVLLVHSKPDEEKFVADGFGIKRFDVMYNDFVIVGPKDDPAKINGLKDIELALQNISNSKSFFASRGDDSGTHKAELKLWKLANVDPKPFSGEWYLETGSGMGKTLNVAIGKNAYALTDRSTWAKYGNKQGFVVSVEGLPPLLNQYGVIAVSADKCPNVKTDLAGKFVNWVTSKEGQQAIGEYRIDGEQVFFPNAQNALN